MAATEAGSLVVRLREHPAEKPWPRMCPRMVRPVDAYHWFFFFSSRRRHTRFDCDWSSDVCSSDLVGIVHNEAAGKPAMVLQRKAIQECDDRIAKLVFLAVTRFLFLLGFLRDDRHASLDRKSVV